MAKHQNAGKKEARPHGRKALQLHEAQPAAIPQQQSKRGAGIHGREVPVLLVLAAISLIAALFLASYLATNYFGNGGPNQLSATTQVAATHADNQTSNGQNETRFSAIAGEVLPENGFVLSVKWGNSVKELVSAGALNVSFLSNAMQQAGQPMTAGEESILNGTSNGNITINSNDTLFVLYTLWALGINNKNPIIADGPIMGYGGSPYNLASTGGYGPLGRLQLGNLSLIGLNSNEQQTADAVASNVYRPCCDNPAMFPDCNHGAAQLGLIELMASQGSNATQIYEALKNADSFYYPQEYFDLAVYFSYTKHEPWGEVSAKEVLGYNYSSASGFNKIHQELLQYNILPQTGGSPPGLCSA